MKTKRRHDPNRRERIIEAALEVMAREGISGASQRKIAVMADVPLGSMTYHFAGTDEVLHEALTLFAAKSQERFERRVREAATGDDARRAAVEMVLEDSGSRMNMSVLSVELCALAARKPAFRSLARDWMTKRRTAFERHFGPVIAGQLDALVHGLSIHRALGPGEYGRGLITDAVNKILADPCEPSLAKAGK